MYAQLSYPQKLGSSNLTISEAGCFDTAFCNTLEKVGVNVDPPTLNTFFTDHHVYTYDLTDRANDDLAWNSVTNYCPQLVVSQTGGAGWPQLDLAIVEFHYRSVQHPTLPNGQPNMITHFCAVNNHLDRSIIDSYDGQVKTPAQYEHVYGQPIAWATYVFHTPQTTPATIPPTAAVSAPKAQTPVPQPPAPAMPTALIMPKTDHYYLWHVFKEAGPWTLAYAIGTLDPWHYGPLRYPILGNPAKDIYIIQTQSFGRVAVYAGPDTVAQFEGGHGEGDPATETPPALNIPVTEVVPAPTATPPAPNPAPAEPTVAAIVYTRFDAPMQLVTKEGAQLVNFASGTIVETLTAPIDFEAVGKATLTADNTTYFMTDHNFGEADVTQHTPITVGIKTIYLQAASTTPPVTASVPVVAPPAPPTPPLPPISAPAKSVSSDLPWQSTFEPIIPGDSKEHPTAVDYIVINDIKVYNFATGNDVRIAKAGKTVPVVGTFWFTGHKYYLSRGSFESHTWYGFPVSHPAPSLVKQTAETTPFETGDDINQIDHEYEAEISRNKHAAIKAGATAEAFLQRFKKKRYM